MCATRVLCYNGGISTNIVPLMPLRELVSSSQMVTCTHPHPIEHPHYSLYWKDLLGMGDDHSHFPKSPLAMICIHSIGLPSHGNRRVLSARGWPISQWLNWTSSPTLTLCLHHIVGLHDLNSHCDDCSTVHHELSYILSNILLHLTTDATVHDTAIIFQSTNLAS